MLKRGRAMARSSAERTVIAINPPTQNESATTCTTKEPIASECEPLDTEWLSNTGAIIATIDVSSSAFAVATVLALTTITLINKAKHN